MNTSLRRTIVQYPLTVLIFIALTMAIFLLSACQSQNSSSTNNQASLIVSVDIGSQQALSLPHTFSNDLLVYGDDTINVSNIFIRIWQAGQLFGDANLLNKEGTVTLKVPVGVELTVVGTAYDGNEIVFQGETNIEPLRPRERTSVPISLVPFGPGISGTSQVDISNGVSGNGKSSSAFFYGNNDFVLFTSTADNLEPDNLNNENNLFVKEISANGQILNVHTDSDGNIGNGPVGMASISATGELVVFASEADNLLGIDQDSNAVSDVFVKEIATNITTRISETSDNTQADQASFGPSISDDGAHIVFVSEAALLLNDRTGLDDRTGIFWLNRTSNTLRYVGTGQGPILSGNGQVVLAWENDRKQLVRYKLGEDIKRTVLVEPYDVPIDTGRAPYSINQTGNIIIYASLEILVNGAETIPSEKANNDFTDASIASDIFLIDLSLPNEQIRLLSLNEVGIPIDSLNNSVNPNISSQSTFVVFSNGNRIYVKSLISNTLEKLAVPGRLPSLSRDGQKIAFTAENQKLYTVDNPIANQSDPDASPTLTLLSLKFLGNGNGQIMRENTRIDCNTDCNVELPQGTLLTLRAVPDNDTFFSGWGGVCESFGNTTSIKLSINAVTNCTATFTATHFSLVLTVVGGAGGGFIVSDDEPQTIKSDDCKATAENTVICDARYPTDTTVTLLPTLSNGTDLLNWKGCTQDNGADGCVVTLSEPRNITATFSASKNRLIVDKTGKGTGRIVSELAGINCGSDCDQEYANQTIISLIAQAEKNSIFSGWTGNATTCQGNQATITINMDNGYSCTAEFNILPVKLDILKNGSGNGIVSSNPSGINCGSDCDHSYDHKSLIILSAAANENSRFTRWEGSCSGTELTVSVSLDEAKTCTASFESLTLDLTISLTGSGLGKVTSLPEGLNCGDRCGKSFNFNTIIKLSALAETNSQFIGWTGDCNGRENLVSVTLDKIKNCVAKFDSKQPKLSVTKSGNGVGTVISEKNGINCGTDCAQIYDVGKKVVLSAVAAINSNFVAWTGACGGTTRNSTVTMDELKTCDAQFDVKRPLLSVSLTGTGAGTITSNLVGINCGEDCSESFDFDTIITLTATAETNSTFGTWTGACRGSDPITTVTMNTAKRCLAKFDVKRSALTVTKSGNGSGSITTEPLGIDCNNDCREDYGLGTEVSLTARPEKNSLFIAWGGACSGVEASVTVTIEAAINCDARFDIKVIPLIIIKTGDGAGSISSDAPGINCGKDCSENYDFGTIITLTAIAEEKSTFVAWTGACKSKSDGKTNIAFVSINDTNRCEAKFDLARSKLSIKKSGRGAGSISSNPAGINCGKDCKASFSTGTKVTLTAKAEENSSFVGWSGSCKNPKKDDISKARVTVNKSRNCTAKFDIKRFKLNVEIADNGPGNITSKPKGIDCGDDCSQRYKFDTKVTLTAKPKNNAKFVSWSGACNGTEISTSITLNAAKKCSANFEPGPVTLTVVKAGTGKSFGNVMSENLGINCGSECSEDVTLGTKITLIASVTGTSTLFAGWGKDCSGTSSSITVTVKKAINCEAKFKLKRVKLEINFSGAGKGSLSIAPTNMSCDKSCSKDFDLGTTVTLTATAASNSTFVAWGGDCSGSALTSNMTMDAAKKCTVIFNPEKIELNITKSGSGSGTVQDESQTINCGSVCEQNYTLGTIVTLRAQAANDSIFVGWSKDCANNGEGLNVATATITLNNAKTCDAKFDKISVLIKLPEILKIQN